MERQTTAFINLTTRDLNLVYFAWMKERGD
jgi:hypothetical protein